MKKRSSLALIIALVGAQAFAQSTVNNVEKLCGCFSVNFKYAETFSPDNGYKYHDREDMNAVELSLPIEKTPTKIVMQHLLVIQDTMIIKHWREEWVYESPVLFTYNGNRQWDKKELGAANVKGKWTQTVWEVSDEPRYQGVSSWIDNDNKTYWESTADAPLPRREYTVRNDYNILRRHNRIVLTKEGYTHEQDNDKILRADGKDKLIAQEKGYNTYVRMEDKDCAAAKEWWKKNEKFWAVVRTEWQTKLSRNVVTVKSKVDDKMMNEHLDVLWREWRKTNMKQADLEAKVKEVFTKFL